MNCIVKTASKLAMCFCLIFFLCTSSNAQEILLSSGEKIDSLQYQKIEALAEEYFSVADSLDSYQKLNEAILNYNESMKLFNQVDNWKRATDVRLRIALALLNQNEPDGLLHLDTAKHTLILHNDTLSASYAMYFSNLSIYHSTKSEYSEAVELTRRAIGILKTAESDTSESLKLLHLDLGFYYGRLSELEKQIYHYEEAYRIMQFYKPDFGVAIALSRLSSCYLKTANFGKALNSTLKARDLTIDLHGPDFPNLSNTYYWLGIIYKDMGEPEKAAQAYREALRIDSTILKGKTFNNSAVMRALESAYELGEYKKSNEIIDTYIDRTASRYKGRANRYRANNYLKLGKLKKHTLP